MPHNRFGLCLAAALLPFAAWADDQPITVTATRIATPVGQVPAGVTVLTQADFARQGDTTLTEALSTVPGLNVVQLGGPGNQASVFIRGTNSEDVLVLLDGVPVNDPANANGAFDFGQFQIPDIERVEVVRGAMSGLYGSHAIGGVINIITKRGTKPSQATISVAGGYPAQAQASATISGVTGNFDYSLSGGIDEEAGFDYTPRRMSVYANHQDPYRARMGSVQLGYTVAPMTRVYLIARAQGTDSASPNLAYPEFDDPNNMFYNSSYFGKLGVSSTLFDGRLSTDLFVARMWNDIHNRNLLDATDPNYASANDIYHGRRTDTQWNNTLRLPDAGLLTHSSLLFGAEYSNDHADENVNEESGGYTTSLSASQHSWSGHMGLQTTIANRLTLTGALRNDTVSSFGNAITWRAGAVLALPEIDAMLKGSVGTGFLAPSLFDLHYIDNYGDRGNPNLRPEYSTGWELGPEFDLPAFGQEDFATLSATYFSTCIRGLIQAQANADYTYTEQNVARANIQGVETGLTLHPANWVTATIDYTYTHAVSGTDGTPLLRRPQHSGSASFTFTPVPGLSIAPQVQYIGRFNDYLYNDAGYLTGTGNADPGTVVNLNVSYRLNDKLTLFATGRNILNSNFEAANGLQIPGASMLIGVRATVE
ncbi:TonB-dependent receptor plug domain-containing protein [Acidocella aromatica]|uniref:Vitamin B12 transporter n=1 Tax=Acidocella aromatica TaxID=1303579 RepID=A0A840VBX6_9PROT|nr:TonB-dependent receptor [Acidocella aromatica]MBB5373134.1 vitamin B12 transporter [Acidocella aromatica]